MKIKLLFTSLFLMLMSFATFAQNEKEPYVVIDEEGTATFYYKDKDSKPTGALPIQTNIDVVEWTQDVRNSVIKVDFDDSFIEYKPTSCAYWFYYFRNLTEISGMKDNLNTENVTNMGGMFEACVSLQNLDLSGFNTANVQYMYEMFQYCQNLKTLNLLSFRTSNVINMSSMFAGCYNLTSIDFSPSGFNTSKVTIMHEMFSSCRSLSYLDLSGFNTKSVEDMAMMFQSCYHLKYILVGDDWSTDAVTKSECMFSTNYCLFGEKGTGPGTYNDATYAKVDGGKDDPGYLTKKGSVVYDPAYAIVKDGTATFYFGAYKPNGTLPMRTEESDKNWTSAIYSTITKVVFDDSFKSFKPYKTSYWFEGFDQLTEIVGMRENLNTSEVVYMNSMFHFCDNLTSIDVSGFDTGMVEDMSLMFYGCENLKSINLSSFNTANVTKMQYMFGVCNNLRSIFVGNDWSTASVTKSYEMFYECNNLYGGKGTSPKTIDVYDATYAKIDGGEENPGYFTQNNQPAYSFVVSIEITALPKTEYTEGEDFSPLGGSFVEKYDDGHKSDILHFLSTATITGYDKTKIGEQTLKVEYQGFETELKVTVKANQPTPVSDITDTQSDIKVWSSNSSIFIESAPDAKYKIIDLNGRILTTSTTKSSKEEIHIGKQGVYVVLVNGDSFKVAIQ